MVRRGSSGSMSERTFRSPSPASGQRNRDESAVEADPNAPPVPAMPKDLPSAHRRSNSVEPTPPPRVTSPGPTKPGGRGVSVDRGTMQPRGRGAAQVPSTLQRVVEVDREDSRRSINFSRPMSPSGSPNSSPTAARTVGKSGWHTAPVVSNQTPRANTGSVRPKTSQGISSAEASGMEASARAIANTPAQKKRVTSGGAEGKHLAGATLSKPTGTAVTKPAEAPQRPATSSGASTSLEKGQRTLDMFVRPQSPAGKPLSPAPKPQTPASKKQSPATNTQSIIGSTSSPAAQDLAPPIQPKIPRRKLSADLDSNNGNHGFQTRAGALLSQQAVPEPKTLTNPNTTPSTATPVTPRTASNPSPAARVAPAKAQVAASNASPSPRRDQPPAQKSPETSATGTLTPVARGQSVGRGERPASVSPGRAAHFSNVSTDLTNGIRHQPPPRSVSPAKSAMKHSPSPSLRGQSPSTAGISGNRAHSENSDNVSESGSIPRKKKTIRVSFDDDAIIAGEAAGPISPFVDTPTDMSSSSWSGKTLTGAEDDFEELMKPRPMLPSFGSVRARKAAEEPEMAEKVTETLPSATPERSAMKAETLEASNDHALGKILHKDFAEKRDAMETAEASNLGSEPKTPNSPLPLEVTSVEGTGAVSDEEDDTAPTRRSVPATSAPIVADPTAALLAASQRPSMDGSVPVLSLQPPTPAATDLKENEGFRVPGTFVDEEETRHEPSGQARGSESNPVEHHPTEPTLSMTGVAEPTPAESKAANIHSSSPARSSALFPALEEEDEDNDSIYSDAAEDLSDLEEGNFASLDAIVESPVVAPSPSQTRSPLPESPSVLASKKAIPGSGQQLVDPEAVEAEQLTDWNRASSYWKGLSADRRKQLEEEASSPPLSAVKLANDDDIPTLKQPTQPKKKKAVVQPTTVQQPATPKSALKPALKPALKQQPPRDPAQATKPALKKTMRGATEDPTSIAEERSTHLRSSMREALPAREGHMRMSMRGPPPAQRQSMPPAEPKGALQKKNIPLAKPRPQSAVAAPGTRPDVQEAARTLGMALPAPDGNDSDASESSFRKQRKAARKGADGGRYTMRGSMRESRPAPSMRPTPTMRPQSPDAARGKSSRFSIRSLSPTGSAMGRGRARRPSFSSDIGPGPSSPKASRFSGFGRSKTPSVTDAPKPAPVAAIKPTPKPRFKSRFGDSDDEGDEAPARPSFRSRFADSDEEDDVPTDLTPVRGIPKKPGEEDGDSTDLEDEEEEQRQRHKPPVPSSKDIESAHAPSAPINGKPKPEGTALASGSLRDKEKDSKKESKRSFFSIRRKKDKEAKITSPISAPTPAATNAATAAAAISADRPSTPPEAAKQASTTAPSSTLVGSTPTGSPKSVRPSSPKLQRRNSPFNQLSPAGSRQVSDSWPLPQPPKINPDSRPMSSDGVTGSRKNSMQMSLRPGLQQRKSTGMTGMTDFTTATAPAGMGTIGEEGEGIAGPVRVLTDEKTGKQYVLSSRTGKKKKFQGLRRVFGLND